MRIESNRALVCLIACLGCAGGAPAAAPAAVPVDVPAPVVASAPAPNDGLGANLPPPAPVAAATGLAGQGGGDPPIVAEAPDPSTTPVSAAPTEAGTEPAPTGAGCADGVHRICEDFEGTEVGAVPAGWMQTGDASVSDGDAYEGTRALRVGAAANGARRIQIDASMLGPSHWGRIHYRVEVPAPLVFVHSTLVALQGVGPTRGDAEYRVVDTVQNAQGSHQFLYNVQPAGPEFGTGSSYDWQFDGAWHCAEWYIDHAAQQYRFFIDGTEVTSIAKDNGAGNYAGTDIPEGYSVLKVGWNNYQFAGTGFVAWIDDVAVDDERVGCIP